MTNVWVSRMEASSEVSMDLQLLGVVTVVWTGGGLRDTLELVSFVDLGVRWTVSQLENV